MAARSKLYEIYLDHVNKQFAIARGMQAEGSGIDSAKYSEPYHAPTTNIFAPQITVPAEPEEKPAAKAGGLLKTLAMGTLMGVGGGGLVGLGAYGASLLMENKPVQIDPASFKTRISFDPDKGLEVGPLEKDVPQ